MNKLSVIIPSKDEAENLPDCVHKIAEELTAQHIEHEILVIDDGSIDETPAVLEKLAHEFRTTRGIRNRGQNGFGRAVRLGLQESSGDAPESDFADGY